jgi:hypothetical protein
MCEPMMIGAGLMSAASIGANMLGDQEQQGARGAAIGAENVRQQGFRNQGSELFDSTLPLAGAPAQTAANAENAGKRSAKDGAMLEANPGVYGTAGASLDGESKSSIARALSGALSRGKQQAKLNADVNGVGDTTSKLGVTLGRAGQWQNIFGNNARSSAALLPGELETANRAGGTMRGIGEILGAGGQAMGTAGLMGGGPSWDSLFSAGGPVSSTVAGPTQLGAFNSIFQR